MNTTVVDASALLAFVQDEDDSEMVEAELLAGARCGAASWSEVAQKVRAAGREWDVVRALLLSYPTSIEPVVADDAEWAARHWPADQGMSLADRLCLALAERMDAPVLTADRSWGTSARVRQIR